MTDRTDGTEELATQLRRAGCVFAEQEAALLRAEATGPRLAELAARRIAGEPLEHVLGWVAFNGRKLVVTPGVFVPRRRTELLAHLAAAALPPDGLLAELCCGVAPVAATVAAESAVAADLDPAAAACARRNLAPERVFAGDLYAALPRSLAGRVDVLVANAPYVPTASIATMPREARLFENRLALDGGADGLGVQRRIAAGAHAWLAPGGSVVCETSRVQATGTAALFAAAGFAVDVVEDDSRDATAVLARLRSAGDRPR